MDTIYASIRYNLSVSPKPHTDGRVQLAFWADGRGISSMTTGYFNRSELIDLMEQIDGAIDAIDQQDAAKHGIQLELDTL